MLQLVNLPVVEKIHPQSKFAMSVGINSTGDSKLNDSHDKMLFYQDHICPNATMQYIFSY